MQLTDTHCHLHFDKFSADVGGVMKRAGEAGVSKMICVGVSLEDSRKAAEFAAKYENVWATAGVHPHEAGKLDDSAKNELAELLNMSRIVAVGETGLDYYRLNSPKEEQLAALRAQLDIGLSAGRPFVFHVRDAWADFWQVLDDYSGIKGVLHSFTGGPKQLEAALSRGLYIALNGIVTFTRDQALLESAKKVPAARLLLETDAPFLLPAGSKNSTCEPADVRLTGEFIARLRNEKIEDIAASTTKNASVLLGLKD